MQTSPAAILLISSSCNRRIGRGSDIKKVVYVKACNRLCYERQLLVYLHIHAQRSTFNAHSSEYYITLLAFLDAFDARDEITNALHDVLP